MIVRGPTVELVSADPVATGITSAWAPPQDVGPALGRLRLQPSLPPALATVGDEAAN